jgi:hypothetical protein
MPIGALGFAGTSRVRFCITDPACHLRQPEIAAPHEQPVER